MLKEDGRARVARRLSCAWRRWSSCASSLFSFLPLDPPLAQEKLTDFRLSHECPAKKHVPGGDDALPEEGGQAPINACSASHWPDLWQFLRDGVSEANGIRDSLSCFWKLIMRPLETTGSSMSVMNLAGITAEREDETPSTETQPPVPTAQFHHHLETTTTLTQTN